jgi:hypothetical protein
MHLLALLVAAVLGSLSFLHAYWAFGGRWAFAASIPHKPGESPILPGMFACLAVAAALLAATYLCLALTFALPLPMQASLVRHGVLGVALVFALRTLGDFRYVGMFKRVTGTEFAKRDTKIYTPLTALLALAVGLMWLLGSRT